MVCIANRFVGTAGPATGGRGDEQADDGLLAGFPLSYAQGRDGCAGQLHGL